MLDSLEEVLLDMKDELKIQRQLLQLVIESLTTKKAVAKFLGVCTKTVETMTQDGRLIEGEAWFYNEQGVKEFIPDGVIEAKRKRELKKGSVIKGTKHKMHPTASKFMVIKNG
ncbi:hypothetical protein [Sulfurimonas paralvinellae]|uniref:DNA-binding protein n=1 Tax=Sulfurimonas paralvinellae TaxID=317658 RepID=A0A7M1B773_9BACT|nr:hypothetical protein [Sulfurimonas paralvinellae]QOP45553.1 hypothetical protein FM071_04345 [Sulfurimonas paralvinellae]